MKTQPIIQETRAYNCIDCGVCTSSCPVSRQNRQFSPRMNVELALAGMGAEVEMNAEIWSCITCGLCLKRCPSAVDYLQFIQRARAQSVRNGMDACVKTHAGAITAIQRLQARDDCKPRSLDWLPKGLKAAGRGEWLYFVGCLPFFQSFFGGNGKADGIGADLMDTAAGAVKLFNAAGIVPAVRADERCCGHDRLWTGDAESFAALARANVRMIRESGARHITASCPECVRSLKIDYKEMMAGMDVEVLHMSEAVVRFANEGRLRFAPEKAPGEKAGKGGKVTFHDPCRLGRHLDVFEAPRKALGQVPGLVMAEMARSKELATCCGTSCWNNCDGLSESIRMERLQEAAATGAKTLVVACPKCQLHFRCSLSNHPEIDLKVSEMTGLLARHITGG